MKKVLIISYFFPPIGGGGVIRLTKFVKYLPIFGWRPLVLTVKEGFYSVKDPSLLKEIPPEAIVKRIKYFEPGHWFKNRFWQSFLANIFYPIFFIPDAQALWIIPAAISGFRLIKSHKIEVIFSSSRSYSDHLAAMILKRLTGVKWVADFRDEWTTSPYFNFVTPIHRNIAKLFERQILKNADMVTTVSPGLTNIFQNILGTDKGKFATITNGYDEEDFRGFTESADKFEDSKFRIIYAGALYGARRSNLFLQAVNELKLKDLEIEFIGRKKRFSHDQTIKKLFKADVLLLILSPQDGPAVLTGKIFEYLRLRKPIFALAPRNSGAAGLIYKYGIGEVADPLSIIDIKQKLTKIYQKWLASRRSGRSEQQNQLKAPSVNIEIFERKNLTENLAILFNKLTKNSVKEISLGEKQIRLCLIGNLQSPQNQDLVNFFKRENHQIFFISTKSAHIQGIKTYYLGKKTNTFWYFIKSTIKIRRLIKKIEPDIVHGQDLVFAGIWAALTSFHPLVLTCWGSDVFRFGEFIWPEKKLISFALKRAEVVTGTSQAVGREAIKIGLQKEKFQLIHFGVDLEKFRKKNYQLPGISSRGKIIFCPRSIAPIYNTDILIKAFSQINKENKYQLILLTNNAQKAYLDKIKDLIIKNDLVSNCHFFDKLSSSRIAQIYNLADVVVSLSSSDGCPRSFLEALACEKKIVITDLPFVKEWKNNQNFWTVPVRDKRATEETLKKALNFSVDRFEKIAKFNRRQVMQIAEINTNFEKLNKLYQDLIQ